MQYCLQNLNVIIHFIIGFHFQYEKILLYKVCITVTLYAIKPFNAGPFMTINQNKKLWNLQATVRYVFLNHPDLIAIQEQLVLMRFKLEFLFHILLLLWRSWTVILKIQKQEFKYESWYAHMPKIPQVEQNVSVTVFSHPVRWSSLTFFSFFVSVASESFFFSLSFLLFFSSSLPLSLLAFSFSFSFSFSFFTSFSGFFFITFRARWKNCFFRSLWIAIRFKWVVDWHTQIQQGRTD